MFRAFSYRLYPTVDQADLMAQSAGCARAIYNAALEQRSVSWQMLRRRVSRNQQDRELRDLKRTEGLEYLGQVNSDVLVQALWDLDRAFDRFFDGLASYPRFKAKGRARDSFRLQQRKSGSGLSLETRRLSRKWGEVKVPKLGWVRFRWDRKPVGNIKNATITREANGWHIKLCCDDQQDQPAARPVERAVGIDAGVAVAYATSDGQAINLPRPSSHERERRLRLERKLARQTKGSARRQRTKVALGKMRARDARRRSDALHKLARQLVDQHDLIGIEDLKVQNMTRSAKGTIGAPGTNVAQKSGLNRSILERGWGTFRRLVTEKAERSGVTVIAINPAHTSQNCAACGHVDAGNRESQAVFQCLACKHQDNADINAAINIKTAALKQHAKNLADGQVVTAHGDPENRVVELRTTCKPATLPDAA